MEILKPKIQLCGVISDFFRKINVPGIVDLFSPHDFNEETAKKICNYDGKDEYYFLLHEGKVIGYGMLRGWDEGYDIPSLGICIDPDFSGKGLGLTLMYHLISCSKLRAAKKIILKVKKNNLAAIALYKKVGFKLLDLNSEYFKGELDLL